MTTVRSSFLTHVDVNAVPFGGDRRVGHGMGFSFFSSLGNLSLPDDAQAAVADAAALLFEEPVPVGWFARCGGALG